MVFRTYSDGVLLTPPSAANTKTFEAAEAVSMGQLLKFDTGSGRTVEPSDADGEGKLAGFVLFDAASGEQVTVAMDTCIVRATSGTGSISSGDWVASHGATGEQGEVASAASGDYTIGKAIEDDAGDGGDAIIYVISGRPING